MAQSRGTMLFRWSIASYWVQQGCFDVELDDPHCFACGLYQPSRAPDGPEAGRWNAAPLDRAHLQDHALGGTEHVSNLVLLCRLCHKLMPRFQDRDKAIAWVNGGCPFYKIPKIAEILHGPVTRRGYGTADRRWAPEIQEGQGCRCFPSLTHQRSARR